MTRDKHQALSDAMDELGALIAAHPKPSTEPAQWLHDICAHAAWMGQLAALQARINAITATRTTMAHADPNQCVKLNEAGDAPGGA